MTKEIILDIQIQGTKKVIELQEEIKNIRKQIKDTKQEDRDSPAFDNLIKQLVVAQNELKKAKKEAKGFKEEVEETADESTGAYKKLSKELIKSRRRLKDLAADGKTNTKEFRELTAQVTKLDTRLKGIDKSVGQFQRNVGNYSGALRLAGRQTREFVGAIGGIPPAANLAVGAFAVLGNLPQIIQQFDEIATAIDDYIASFTVAGRLNKRFAETFDNVVDGFIEEKAEIDSLVVAATDETLSKEQQIAARQKLEEISGVTLTNIEDETQLLEQLKLAQDAATESLIENTVQQARANLISDITKEIVENERDRLQQSKDLRESFLGQGIDAFAEFAKDTDKITNIVADNFGKTQTFTESLIDEARNNSRDLLQEELQNLDLVLQPLEQVLRESLTAVGDFSGAAKGTAEDLNEDLAKQNEKAAKKRFEAAKRELERLQKLREKALADQLKLEQANAAQLLKLQDQFVDAQIKNIQDEKQRRIAEINRSFEKRLDTRQKNFDKLKADAVKQEQQLAEAFGEGSAQVIAFRKRNAEQVEQISKELTAIEVEEEKRRQQQILDVQEDFAQKRFKQQLDNAKAQSAAIQAELTNELNRIEQIRAQGDITREQAEKQSLERRKQSIVDQLVALEKQRILLNESELEDIDDQIQQIVSKRQALNTQLAQLEEKQTDKVKTEAKKRTDSQIKTIDAISKTFTDSIGFIDQFTQGIDQRQQQRFELEKQQQQKRLDALNERLNKASGLEKKFLEKRVQEETTAANEIAAAQERAQRRAARTQKAIAIAQAAINGALAVTRILLQTTDFTPVQAFRAAAVAGAIATTAAQIAVISAQPLATGGVVGKNIKGKSIKRSNGDDTLTTLKTGEVVLNKTQQARLGGAKTFRSIGVPGFATGGIVSAPLPPPNIVTAPNPVQSTKVLEQITKLSIETANKLNKLEVVYTTNTRDAIQRDDTDRAEIKTRATL
ncbi:MAG: hypothetical protein MK212_07425 [Saprospiraceae bacterium]|uniref:hypothetical protein n=1 Tax=Kordia sp. TaxID=1965332 RepID=UPI0025C30F47|nr:hypothetical protein [Kordia sp.]MCH2043960.1 hypothetical protein [Saprospiraceae bacterium]MCH2196835.1 hypothetical protein [Kordia sp.]